MLRKIYRELVRIRKELQAIRSSMESSQKPLTKALCDIAGFEALDKIEKAILEMYTEIKKQGSVLTGIENLHRQLCFKNPELAAHIKKRMLVIAKENGDLP